MCLRSCGRLVRTGFLEDMAKKGLTDLSYFKHIGTRATKDEDGPFSLQTSTKVRSCLAAFPDARPIRPATISHPTGPHLALHSARGAPRPRSRCGSARRDGGEGACE